MIFFFLLVGGLCLFFRVLVPSSDGKIYFEKFGRDRSGDESLDVMDVGRQVEKAHFDSNLDNVLVIGGKGNLAQVFDLDTQKEVWKAKNVKKDWLDMEVPIWDKDAQYLNESNGNSFITTTAYGHVMTYFFFLTTDKDI